MEDSLDSECLLLEVEVLKLLNLCKQVRKLCVFFRCLSSLSRILWLTDRQHKVRFRALDPSWHALLFYPHLSQQDIELVKLRWLLHLGVFFYVFQKRGPGCFRGCLGEGSHIFKAWQMLKVLKSNMKSPRT